MGCFNVLFLFLLGAIYFLPELRPMMDIEGFWFAVGLVWFIFFISFALFGDIADEIAGVRRDDDEF
tara:strand:- start:284 stop:481 length:198 start_codon:yes stop_codon:yes gene_type:complete